MPQKTLDGKDVPEEDTLWADDSYFETMSDADWKKKERTFTMKHDEEMNYHCQECKATISAHNKDWHNGMCDGCFDKMVG